MEGKKDTRMHAACLASCCHDTPTRVITSLACLSCCFLSQLRSFSSLSSPPTYLSSCLSNRHHLISISNHSEIKASTALQPSDMQSIIYPSSPSSSSSSSNGPLAGLELLLGAAELLENASPRLEEAMMPPLGRATTPLFVQRTNKAPFSHHHLHQYHPFHFTGEEPHSRLQLHSNLNSGDSDDRESDVERVRSSTPLPFTVTTMTTKHDMGILQRTSASWPGASSNRLFVPSPTPPEYSMTNRPSLLYRTLSSPAPPKPSSTSSNIEDNSRTINSNKTRNTSPSSSSSSRVRPSPIKRAQTAISCARCRSVSFIASFPILSSPSLPIHPSAFCITAPLFLSMFLLAPFISYFFQYVPRTTNAWLGLVGSESSFTTPAQPLFERLDTSPQIS